MSMLQTDRLILRPFNIDDAKMMFENWTFDERVAKYCRWYPHTSVSMTEALLKMYLEQAATGFDYRWAITLKGKDEPIGCIDVVDVLDNGKTAEIGYVLGYSYWGKGIATESLKAVIDELFNDGFTCIIAKHHTDNPASGRVMEKCGMHFVKYDKEQSKFGSDDTCDVKCYELQSNS